MSEKIKIWLAFGIACLVWGSTWLAIKIGLASMPPFLGAGIRFFIASLILFAIIKMKNIEIPVTADARRLYAVLVIFSFTIPFAFVYWAEQYIPTGLASILFATYTFCAAIFSQFMLKDEPLNVWKVSGIVIGFVGLVIIFFGDIHINNPQAVLAMILIVANAIMQAYALVLTRKIGKPFSPYALNWVGMFFGGIALLGLSLVFESHDRVVLNAASIGSILYLSTIGSVLVFVAYYWLIKRVEAVYLSLVSFITPIVAVLLGAIVLDEVLGLNVFMGAAFVLAGLLVANGKRLFGRVSAIPQ